ncbi:MAG: GNAT family N-acetyltransferase [Chitinophagaceae bacterium]|nr:GNAT family N-acetyltransferase [Chitinophagaceae bacterium]
MIRLELFDRSDFQQLMNWIETEELMIKWSGSLFSFPLTMESLEWYIDGSNILNQSDAFSYKAIDTDTGAVVGHISLGGLSWKNRSSRISRVLVGDRAYHGKGVCQQMTKAVLKIGFEELGLHRISLGVYENNKAALNCYLKAGFSIEGVARDILWFNNEYLSMIEMGILENEWRNGNP